MRIRLPLFAAALTIVGACQASANCFSLAAHEPHRLSGRLHYVLFAGPPNFEDVQKGDTPEPSYVLRLEKLICLSGDEFADPEKYFSTVQIVGDRSTSGLLKANVGRFVSIELRDPMAASTAHHHEPLVAWATGVTAGSHPPARVRSLDFIDEYGGPATTVRTFYEVLKDGRGEVASKMIVPEKRSSGPLAAGSLTRFYSHLKQPIQLDRIDQAGPNTFIAQHRYATSSRACVARARITTTNRSGRNYIARIEALDGC